MLRFPYLDEPLLGPTPDIESVGAVSFIHCALVMSNSSCRTMRSHGAGQRLWLSRRPQSGIPSWDKAAVSNLWTHISSARTSWWNWKPILPIQAQRPSPFVPHKKSERLLVSSLSGYVFARKTARMHACSD